MGLFGGSKSYSTTDQYQETSTQNTDLTAVDAYAPVVSGTNNTINQEFGEGVQATINNLIGLLGNSITNSKENFAKSLQTVANATQVARNPELTSISNKNLLIIGGGVVGVVVILRIIK